MCASAARNQTPRTAVTELLVDVIRKLLGLDRRSGRREEFEDMPAGHLIASDLSHHILDTFPCSLIHGQSFGANAFHLHPGLINRDTHTESGMMETAVPVRPGSSDMSECREE